MFTQACKTQRWFGARLVLVIVLFALDASSNEHEALVELKE